MGTSRATATVLFTDLVGSTELRARLGEGAAEDLRRLHDKLLADAVEANTGRVVKGLGDGIMASFSAASDAVAAAVAIQQSVDRYNRRPDLLAELAVRVGISLGDVTFEGDDVHGTPVIEAARLCAAATGGQILASDLVRVLVGSGHAEGFVPVGPLDLKGLAQPVVTGPSRGGSGSLRLPEPEPDRTGVRLFRSADGRRVGHRLFPARRHGGCSLAVRAADSLREPSRMSSRIWFGSYEHHLGLLARTIGRVSEADGHVARAAEIHQRLGATTWLARTYQEWKAIRP